MNFNANYIVESTELKERLFYSGVPYEKTFVDSMANSISNQYQIIYNMDSRNEIIEYLNSQY